jgi:hypothetical protein
MRHLASHVSGIVDFDPFTAAIRTTIRVATTRCRLATFLRHT